jgi:DNA-binding NarL/FixJ family response regulator
MASLPKTAMNPRAPLIRVALVEDRAEDRQKILAALHSSPDFDCVVVCASAEEARQTIPRHKPDIVLMDIQLPGESGIDCVRHLKDVTPGAEIMMLTIFEDHERIFQSLAAGATGYLLKKTPPDKLLEAIRELRAGGAPMSGQIARQVVTAFQRPSPPAARLSPMEQKVLQLLARGHLYKEVADQLEIKISTVRTYVWHIYRKLQVHNRTEAVLKALPMRPV